MSGCFPMFLIWATTTGVLVWLGPSPDTGVVLAVVAGGVLVCVIAQALVLRGMRARLDGLSANYVQLYGPLPEDFKAWGTRGGGTAGRLLGGTTGYLVGGAIGAALDIYKEKKKLDQMTEPQRELLNELNRMKAVNPAVSGAMMLGALILSWLLATIINMF